MIRVILPHHLRKLAGVGAEVQLEVDGPATPRAILDALESRFPHVARYNPRARDRQAPTALAVLCV